MSVGIGFMATFLVIFIATVVLLTIASENNSENWSVLIVILFSFFVFRDGSCMDSSLWIYVR